MKNTETLSNDKSDTVAPVERLTYNAAEACAALGISSVSLWRLEKRGLLRPVRYLRHKLYPVAQLRAFAEGQGGAR